MEDTFLAGDVEASDDRAALRFSGVGGSFSELLISACCLTR